MNGEETGVDCGGSCDACDEACADDNSTTDSWGLTCQDNYDIYGYYCYSGTYDDDDFDECNQCCACEDDAGCSDVMSSNDDNEISSDAAQNQKMLAALTAHKDTNNPQTVVNLETGEVTESGEGNRYVTYAMTLTYEDDYGYPTSLEFTTADTELLIWGWSDGESGCATVRAVSSLYGSTLESNELCANAGGCPDADADGVCDDVDDCVGEYDDCGECNGDGSSCACLDGDVNGDDVVNVSDIVNIVNYILSGGAGDIECADMNGDDVVNVSDIVQVVNYILGGGTARVMNATDATVTIAGDELSVSGNGFVQGVQLTLSHTSDFSIELADAYVAEYVTENNMTTVIVVTDGSSSLSEIARISGDYDIESVIVVDGNGSTVSTTQTTEIVSFELSEAYPNPFNPTTNVVLSVPEASYVSVRVYNLVGQEVATLASGMMEANTYTLTWDASSMSSGVYLVRAEGAGQIATQKLMLLK